MTLFTDQNLNAIDKVVTAVNSNVPDILATFSLRLHHGELDLFGRNYAINAKLCNGWSGDAGGQEGHQG
jgi:hypothetical protein